MDMIVCHICSKDDAKSYFPLSVNFLNKATFGLDLKSIKENI